MNSWVNLVGWLERVLTSREVIPLAIATYLTIVGLGVFALVLVLGLVWLKLVAKISRWVNISVHDIRGRILIVALSAGVLAILGVGVFQILPHVGAPLTKTQDIAGRDSGEQQERNPPQGKGTTQGTPGTATTPVTPRTQTSGSRSQRAPQCPALDPDEVIRVAQEIGLTILAGPKSGPYVYNAHAFERAAADYYHVRVRVKMTDGSWYNVTQLLADKDPGTVAFSQREFPNKLDRRGELWVAYDDVFVEQVHFLVPTWSPIKAFTDLKSKTIGVVGSGSMHTLQMLLDAAQIGPRVEQVDMSEGLLALSGRRMHALFYVAQAPVQPIADAKDVRLLPIEDSLREKNTELWENYSRAIITGRLYPRALPNVFELPTIGARSQVVAHRNINCHSVEFIKKVIEEHHPFDLQPQLAQVNPP